jgi:hypothetical protein
MVHSTIANLTINEFKILIKDVVKQTIFELLNDPDDGLELREEIKIRLQQSLAEIAAGGKTIPAQEVAAKLGLEW